uniref:Myosin motor domain-containing protein n=1 Tax=Syphacia muris TaxID=451379 RepID=A0A158R688_9BILA
MAADYENDPGWQYLRRSREQMLEDQSAPYDSKKNCWIPDKEEGYLAAEIVETKGDQVVVTVNGSQKTVKADLVSQMNPPKFEKTEDMSNLTFLNDASVLHNLRARYKAMLIYTYSGLFCVVINPYKRLPIYTDSVARMFMGKRRNEMPPHLFAVSDEAFRNMLQNHENQSMLITGESGAGKTENTKKVIAYFASVGASQQEAAGANKDLKPGEKKVTLEDQIVQTNPVLEAFGNARTVRNNNSSRFGKFIRIHFSKYGRVASCDIEHYLLEKSRVIRQAPGERCYHIFYQMTSDLIPDLKEKLLLDRPMRDYWFVAQAELTVDGMDDKEEFALTDEAFDILHFSQEEKLNCYKLMSAHMHLGIMKFKQRPREEQAEPDGTEEAEKAAAMYGVDTEELLKAFTHPRVRVGTEWVNKGQNVDQVTWAQGAMGKAIYARVFSWLVRKCNITLDQKGVPRDYFIGVLDIAGFEIFDFNSFEQLWINFVNEKLQQFFNHHMFVLEQEEYAREGINWTFIDFGLDLQACIELIEKPMGIISMLDEECIVPKATDMTLAQKLNEQHLGKHPNFEKPKPPKGKQAEAHFAMRHYAGVVRYNVTNWLEKNKDPLNDTVAACLKASKGNALLNEIWADYTTQEEAAAAAKSGGGGKKKGKSGSFMTVSMLYRESLNSLMGMLYKTHPHFIRCIIPNEKKTSGLLDASLVLNQLTCNGVLEGIRICRKGFPNRTLHPDFRERYAVLGPLEAKSSEDPKVCAENILNRLVKQGDLTEENYRIGHTKVFFKAGVLAHLEDLRDERLAYLISGLQAQIRQYYIQIDLKERREVYNATKVIQYNARDWITLREWRWFKIYASAMPLVRASKVEEILSQLKVDVVDYEKKLEDKKKDTDSLQAVLQKAMDEKAAVLQEIKNSRSENSEAEDRIDQLTEMQKELEQTISEATQKFDEECKRTSDAQDEVRKLEDELDAIKKLMQDTELGKRKMASEKAARDNQIRSLQEEVAQQDETIAKLTKEKKHQEEKAKKMSDDMKSEEERNEQANRVRAKLEQGLEELDDNISREKRSRQDAEKAKRKAEGDLKIAKETLDEISKQKRDIEVSLKKKDAEVRALESKLENEQNFINRVTKNGKDEETRIQELEEELNNERDARSKSERARSEIQAELEEMTDRLDEQSRATSGQIEIGKKQEAEIAKLRRELEGARMTHESTLASTRKRNIDGVAQLGEQLDDVKKTKLKAEKERAALQKQLDDITAQLDAETKAKADRERAIKNYEERVADLQSKSEEQSRQLQELTSQKNRLHNENSDIARQADDIEEQLAAMTKVKAQLVSQLEEAKRSSIEDTRERQSLNANVKNLQLEVDQVRSSLDDEIESKSELIRQLSKANLEIQQWKSKFEEQGFVPADAVENIKKKQQSSVLELEEALDTANSKLAALEKMKTRLNTESDEAHAEAERHLGTILQYEKKQKAFEKVISEWKKKVDDLNSELDAAQRECRNASTNLFKEQATNDGLNVQIEGLKHENKNLSQEIRDLQNQLSDGGRNVHDMQKMIRRLEAEKDELQRSLDEAEAALEAEESKVARAQLEVTQIRAEIDKRIQEKEEEFENTRKNHQRTIEVMQASYESEKKEKVDLTRVKRKLEMDISELEVALDHAVRANDDAQKNSKRYADQIVELQAVIDDEQRRREEFRENFLNAEKKLAAAQVEKEDLMVKTLQMERNKKQMDSEVNEVRAQLDELTAQSNDISAAKKKLDADILLLKTDLDETYTELRASEERAKNAALEASRLAEQLRQEQERSQIMERDRKGLELNIKELQAKIDEAETAMLKGSQKAIAKLEHRAKMLSGDLEGEKRRYQEAMKNASKQDRKSRELQFQVEENKKRLEQLQDVAEKLQAKAQAQKRRADEAEEAANMNLQKYRQLHVALENAEERAEAAENGLQKIRSMNRGNSVTAPQNRENNNQNAENASSQA